jgi:arginyl-tRNA synthetase
VVALQSGDGRTLRLWRTLVDESARHFDEVYALLGVELRPEDTYGESFYQPMLADTIDDLGRRGLTRVSDGAVCVFPPGFTGRAGEPLPLILRKRDGGYGYTITDLATVRYWIGERGATDLVYVVGTPQAQHFQMVFAACRMAGYLGPDHTAVHIGFGTVLGADGKTIRTRAGGSVKLVELLNEAVRHAAEVVREHTDLPPEQQAEVARAVGIGAVKYADLSGDRAKDYVFTWEKMLAKDGNTAVYLQYAHARIRSILRRAGRLPAPGAEVLIDHPAERALALKLLQFPAAIEAALEDLALHGLCAYLHETAAAFTAFYDTCPVLREGVPEPVRDARLVLCGLASRVLALGLSLLGIEAPERM